MQIIRAKADPAYKPPFTSMVDCVKQSFAANGVRAPFQGLSATLLRNIPANSVYLGSFEVMKMRAAAHYNCTIPELPAWTVLSAASLGGIMYWVVIFPVDVIKSVRRRRPRCRQETPSAARGPPVLLSMMPAPL